jgi:hypothetical protein
MPNTACSQEDVGGSNITVHALAANGIGADLFHISLPLKVRFVLTNKLRLVSREIGLKIVIAPNIMRYIRIWLL